jgi:hypothetical protein
MNVTESAPYLSQASFHVTLDDVYNQRQTIHLIFRTVNITQGLTQNYTVQASVMEINPSTGLLYEQPFFTGDAGNFNWMNVKIFYDTYNDVYNITMFQYNLDASGHCSGYIHAPTSEILKGQQRDALSTQIEFTGNRYAPSNILNSIYFWLESNAPQDMRSFAYLDQLHFSSTQLAGVYANLKYYNSTYNLGKQYMNNSLIVAYQPPKYPASNASYDLEYPSTAYMTNYLNPGLLSPNFWAPSWLYRFPIVVTDNDTLNELSILNILNDANNPVELWGTLGTNSQQEFGPNPSTALYLDKWYVNNSMTSPYSYYFSSNLTSRVIKVDYYSDVNHMDVMKDFQMYSDYTLQSALVLLSNGWGDFTTPGYNVNIMAMISIGSLMAIVIVLLMKKRVQHL